MHVADDAALADPLVVGAGGVARPLAAEVTVGVEELAPAIRAVVGEVADAESVELQELVELKAAESGQFHGLAVEVSLGRSWDGPSAGRCRSAVE